MSGRDEKLIKPCKNGGDCRSASRAPLSRKIIYPPPPPPRFFPRKLSIFRGPTLPKTPLHAGFSLIEVLITATIGLILGAGVLKLSQIAIENTLILKTIFAEQKLEKAVSDALTDQTHCKDILGPFHSKTDRPISVTNDSAKTYKYGVKIGEFEPGLINIQAIKLDPPNPLDSANTEADYIVYFKKPRLGKYATLGGGKCTSGTTAGDQAGCYFVKCKMDYFCSDNACGGTSDQCRLKTCEGNTQAPGVANQKCEAGKVLIGFNSAGQTICCRPGEQWDETSSPPQCKCPTGKTWNDHRCGCLRYQYESPAGTCVNICKLRQRWNPLTRKCECPEGSLLGGTVGCSCPAIGTYYQTSIMAIWNETEWRCECPPNYYLTGLANTLPCHKCKAGGIPRNFPTGGDYDRADYGECFRCFSAAGVQLESCCPSRSIYDPIRKECLYQSPGSPPSFPE